MKNNRHKRTAEAFGMLEKVESLEKDLLKVPGVVEVEFDLDGFYDNLNEVIFVAKYDIPQKGREFLNKAAELKNDVIQTAAKHNLVKSPDGIEDYGNHFYFVFTRKDDQWKVKEISEIKGEKTMAKAKYSDNQVAVLRKFIRAGYDIGAVKNPELNEKQLKELYLGVKSGLDISLYNSPKISAEEMKELRRSAAKGVDLRNFAEAVIKTGEYNKEQTLQILDAAKHGISYKNMLNPELGYLQMRQIKLGERYGIDTSVYADADFSAEQMQQLRLELIVRKVMENIRNFFREAWEKICNSAAHNIPQEEAANIKEAVLTSSEEGLADRLFSEATLIIVSSKISDKIVEQVLEAERGLENETILNSMEMAETVSEELAAEADDETEENEKKTENKTEVKASEAESENEFGTPPLKEEVFEMEEVM